MRNKWDGAYRRHVEGPVANSAVLYSRWTFHEMIKAWCWLVWVVMEKGTRPPPVESQS